MKIQIMRIGKEIISTIIDIDDIVDKGELSHVICELERIRITMLKKWVKAMNEVE